MTANQLQFQRNAIAEQEANEAIRANKAREQISLRELAQKRELTEKEQNIQERENFAKYGSYKYAGAGEQRGGAREYFDLIRRGFEYAINPILSIFSGGKK